MEGGSTRYEVHLRFSQGERDDSHRGFTIGEITYPSRVYTGSEITLPHQIHPFFHDLPSARVETVELPLSGAAPRVYARIILHPGQKDQPVIGSLIHWYQHQNQLEFSFPKYSYAQVYPSSPDEFSRRSHNRIQFVEPPPQNDRKRSGYRNLIRRAVEKIPENEREASLTRKI